MRRSGRQQRGEARSCGFPTPLARLGLWLAALALLSQSLALAASPRLGGARSAAAELAAIIGPGVLICAQAPDPGAPVHPYDDCDHCPLCQAATHAFALDAPAAPALPAPALVFSAGLDLRTATAPPAAIPGFALARGPPSQT